MARRLTDQQRRRIALQQTRRRSAVASEDAPDETQLGGEQEVLIVAHYGRQVDVETLDDAPRSLRCFLRTNMEALVTGDRVIAKLPTPDSEIAQGVVVASSARRSLLSRPDSRGLLRPIAANIDVMLVTIAPAPEPFPFLVDRYLVAAHLYGIAAAIVCNKTDLLNDENRAVLDRMLHVYQQIGYSVFSVSTQQEKSLHALRQFLQSKTSVIVGQSGVGKSSLIHALLPDTEIAIGELSAGVEKGKHTTTTARLYHLPEGGDLIDSPGIRELTLPAIPAPDLLSHFSDLQQHAHGCRFRDCQHEHEPDCAVLAAEQSGKIFPERLASYRHILTNLV
ncbi:MAG: small ribosomal subunit biogenesis GTPase RsgA [Cellvibrionales bacterium]|nr:small ribosomal subunit biogenesis GTPase RsgA [Cellvibrionales bacterium]